MKFTEVVGEDGKVWRLRYSNGALRWIERKIGINFMQGADLGALSLDDATMIVTAGLLHENRDATVEDGDDYLDSVGLQRGYEAALQALQHWIGADLDSTLLPTADNGDGTDSKNVLGAGTTPK